MSLNSDENEEIDEENKNPIDHQYTLLGDASESEGLYY